MEQNVNKKNYFSDVNVQLNRPQTLCIYLVNIKMHFLKQRFPVFCLHELKTGNNRVIMLAYFISDKTGHKIKTSAKENKTSKTKQKLSIHLLLNKSFLSTHFTLCKID